MDDNAQPTHLPLEAIADAIRERYRERNVRAGMEYSYKAPPPWIRVVMSDQQVELRARIDGELELYHPSVPYPLPRLELANPDFLDQLWDFMDDALANRSYR